MAAALDGVVLRSLVIGASMHNQAKDVVHGPQQKTSRAKRPIKPAVKNTRKRFHRKSAAHEESLLSELAREPEGRLLVQETLFTPKRPKNLAERELFVFQGEFDELLAQLGKFHARHTCGVGNQRRIGHAGQRVGFQDPALALLVQHEVAARNAAAAKD